MRGKSGFAVYIRIVSAMMALLVITSSAAYSLTKIVERSQPFPNAPIDLTELRSQKQPLIFGEAFEAGAGWLKDLSFQVGRWVRVG